MAILYSFVLSISIGIALGSAIDTSEATTQEPHLNHTELGCPAEFICECLMTSAEKGNKKVIDCSDKNLNEVPGFIALTGHRFDELLLMGNKIKSLFKNAFQGLHVKVIDLSKNEIASVSDNAFMTVAGVKELSMAENKLNAAPVSIQNLNELKKLNLANNQIAQLSPVVFEDLDNLEMLDLSGNPVQFASPFSAAESLGNLRVLKLENCSIPNLPLEVLKHVNSLEVLNVKRNNITSIPEGAFAEVPNIKEIDLEGNSITLDDLKEFSELRYLKILKLSHCHFTNISADIMKSVIRLHTLVLRHCHIHHVHHGPFRNMFHLSKLDLSGNPKINITDDLFHGLEDRLKFVGIENTNLTSFPASAFRKLFVLKKIKANRNPIKHLPEGVFRSLKGNNVEIHLDKCEIFNISANVLQEAKTPVKLYLRENKIVSLNFIAEDPCLFYRSELHVDRNPITCDCEVAEAVQQKTFTLSGTCSAPEIYQGLQLSPQFGEPMEERVKYLETTALSSCPSGDMRVNSSHTRYDCNCGTWLDFNSTVVCAGFSRVASSSSIVLLLTIIASLSSERFAMLS